MPKFTIQQLVEIVEAAGVPAVEIVDDPSKSDPDFDVHNHLSTIDESRKAIIIPQFEASVNESATKAATGKASGLMLQAMLNKFKATGITRKELEDKGKIEDQLDLCLERHNATFSKDNEALRNELTAQAEKFTKSIEEKETKYKQQLQQKEAEYVERDLREWALGVISKKSNYDGDNLERAKGLLSNIREQAHIHWDADKKMPSFRDKNNNEVPLLNDTKTKELDGEYFEDQYAQKMGYRMKDARSLNPSQQMGQKIATQLSNPETELDPRDAVANHIKQKLNAVEGTL